jgi:stage V sporulation protein SpoVS
VSKETQALLSLRLPRQESKSEEEQDMEQDQDRVIGSEVKTLIISVSTDPVRLASAICAEAEAQGKVLVSGIGERCKATGIRAEGLAHGWLIQDGYRVAGAYDSEDFNGKVRHLWTYMAVKAEGGR